MDLAALFLIWINLALSAAENEPEEGEYVLVEGDIKMTLEDYSLLKNDPDGRRLIEKGYVDFSHASTLLHNQTQRRKKRAVTAFRERLWHNATIPYVMGDKLTDFVADNIRKAISHWEKHTCIRFVNRTENDTDYIHFDPGDCGCCSFVGRKGGSQEVTLSPHCAAYGVVIHELGHVIGFWHEHSRPDRDKYIKILRKNIIAEKLDNFDLKSAGEIDSLGQPYDYYSIMHYRRKTFSKSGKNTMEPVEDGVYIGQRDALSPGDKVQANLLYHCPKPECGDEVVSRTGNISSPNYPVRYYRDHSCTWIFHVHSGERIFLDFQDVDVEASSNCSYDYIEFRDGIDETSRLIGRLCGTGRGGILTSTRSVWVKFVSDKSVAQRGFVAHYWKGGEAAEYSGSGEYPLTSSGSSGSDDFLIPSDSLEHQPTYSTNCADAFTERKGEISSPLILSQYNGAPTDCSWTIDGGIYGKQIQLEIQVVSLRDTPEVCAGDIYQRAKETVRRKRLKASSDRSAENTSLKREDGSGSDQESDVDEEDEEFYEVERFVPVRYNCQQGKKMVLQSSTVMIQWSSDINQPFSLKYLIDFNECKRGDAACEHECHNTLQGYTCSCHRGYEVHANFLHKCVPKAPQFADKCNSTLSSERGRLRASTEPTEICQFTIRPPEGLRALLMFVKFRVSPPAADDNCTDSYVEVFTGRHKNSRGRFCGHKAPGMISTSSGLITIETHANMSSVFTMPYFTAEYSAFKDEQDSGCSARMTANGHISSPHYPTPYPGNMNCVWRVSAPKSHAIRIHFDDVDIEATKNCEFDYVEFREGRHRTSPLIARFCGNMDAGTITTTGRHLWANFVSDRDGNGQGFRAQLSSIGVSPSKDNSTDVSAGSTIYETESGTVENETEGLETEISTAPISTPAEKSTSTP